ncbi:MAG: LytTR family transcriptional regulator [Saprospiraceae bacterium]|nr:LytTR family transcriptional regulator [Saprospiraceae bacterium]MBX2926227.1 LytTR family transcriptional regulator [Saprospiraceae bacterium]
MLSTAIIDKESATRRFEKIALPTTGALHLVTVADIVHIESHGSYVSVFTQKPEKIILSRTIKSFETLLPESDFFRIHQSHLINVNCVEKVLCTDGDFVQMNNGACLPISRRRREEFMTALLASGAVKRL